MDFLFNSLAAPDPASPPPEPDTAGSASPPPPAATSGWGFGGLLKTLTTQSETVLETYRRDLAEFSTGLRRETDAFREAAARAARDLPSSAHALDGLADIVAQGKDALAQAAAAATPSSTPPSADAAESDPSSASGHLRYYSRFEAQLRALQSDPATFGADPEDAEDFAAWRREAGFSVDERQEEIEALCYESDAVEGMLDRLVPDAVDAELFWARYFYRVHKLKQQEDARAKLVKRVIAQEEEEDLSWELDDEVEEEPPTEQQEIKQASINEEPKHEVQEREAENSIEEVKQAGALDKETKNADAPQPEVFGSSMVVVDKEEKEDASKSIVEESSEIKTVAEEPRSSAGDDAVKEGAKHETSDSSKDSDYSLVSRQQTATEDDLEWDEIEDLGEHEEKKGSAHGSSPAPKEELRKRLSVAEDDEDLSWDIEDDDDKA
ncbi:BSD domain-containing protein 1-like [Lolium rigidum]|uniref:BSD domain-containing protein 1-like n=1 Tax=Lolium rigidum TaxID=89674 RepID=UPI001F5CFA90|nr:BSD domain-containing protein 1-like [Lolium rigidum]